MDKDTILLSLVVPTYNEIANLDPLLSRLHSSLRDISYEIIFVDDNSPDGTGKILDSLADEYHLTVIHRKGKLGLASAVLEGFRVASGSILGFMDADLSHPPETIPEMLRSILERQADIVIGSRLVDGGGVIGQWPQHRYLNSYIAEVIARPLTCVRDSMSGFVLLKRSVIENVPLIPRGYKMGLEILVKGNYSKAQEVPILFDNRKRGSSKLDCRTRWEYLVQIIDLYLYKARRVLKLSKRTKTVERN
ncbi:MAG TPA: polyprenol monophosphomannose synthase [bacterium]|nr:polyprenol monophosphomannose synthase [bacterium]